MRGITNFFAAQTYLNGKGYKKLYYETWVVQLDKDCIAIQHHNSYIVKYFLDKVILSTPIQSRTTKKRINLHTEKIYISQERETWFVHDKFGDIISLFYNGITFDSDYNLISSPQSDKELREDWRIDKISKNRLNRYMSKLNIKYCLINPLTSNMLSRKYKNITIDQCIRKRIITKRVFKKLIGREAKECSHYELYDVIKRELFYWIYNKNTTKRRKINGKG